MDKDMKTADGQRVIVITDRKDAHLPFVERHLDAPFIVLDPQEFLAGKELSYELIDGRMVPVYDGVKLDSISGVWYRKPLDIADEAVPVSQDFKDYARTAMQRHFNLLLTSFEDATWISDYYSLLRANNKSWQLAVAKRLGMHVPDTIITSDKKAAKTFLGAHPRSVTKPLTIAFPKIEGKTRAFFTTLLEEGYVPDLTHLHYAPAIFQEAIDIIADVRVTVVGEQVFAAAVHAEGLDKNSKVYDYRLGHYEGKVIIKALDDFPGELARQCVAHTKTLGLRFGALDFVTDSDGTYWFLENNPNGQWAFIEDATGQQIGKAVADLLQSN
jgi:glutathione synthase/RimK-type ligase-like ATP-grasp enzyme